MYAGGCCFDHDDDDDDDHDHDHDMIRVKKKGHVDFCKNMFQDVDCNDDGFMVTCGGESMTIRL